VGRGSPRTYDVDVAALDLDELEERLRTAGHSDRAIRGVVGYAVQLQLGRDVELPRATDSRYRRLICEAYGIPPGPPPRNGKPKLASVTPLPARAERGSAKVGAMVAGLACSAIAVLAPQGASAAPRIDSPAFEAQAPIIQVSRRSGRSEGRRAA
jgi:hypothetical protein